MFWKNFKKLQKLKKSNVFWEILFKNYSIYNENIDFQKMLNKFTQMNNCVYMH